VDQETLLHWNIRDTGKKKNSNVKNKHVIARKSERRILNGLTKNGKSEKKHVPLKMSG